MTCGDIEIKTYGLRELSKLKNDIGESGDLHDKNFISLQCVGSMWVLIYSEPGE